ncbi:bifunctional [glutamine synthetase] adenylyltransferase/[glutamine synthetase]-adenylyl-L-tyrosine phosphorylase [Sphingomonas sp. SUN039]|uniref:bifunctional [glutamine synthetase] adenylyltransferase/[glutamine synthetase]-adenylyl-L-tyrosine phosphorylase n=1 Tax=Sphingomonas sp. SUN039 TaxID=2937787 RepID=UPI002164B57E|nr:bifunctional [glutamine synthetase] adenylyltransferase/[glutamine synthetase]-adenylyl-L-tyrosine phosphorylase [Sphingomonas sp. SUN039]UVO54443.1 bifunctional [glutamine synthetase] adenylyltransferase/[glutamine synthetase]-adenylyl-L-tyrosine phosphorylase [Sphingomonas sp. SUN039]
MSAVDDAVARAEAASPFLRQLIVTHADIVAAARVDPDAALALAAEPGEGDTARQLRRMRGRHLLAIALADLSGAWPLETSVGALSDFADRALDIAIAEAIRGHVPDATVQGLAVIALGKHGSRELNYSSDIDPIFIYDPATLPHRAREEPGEAAVRIVRRVVDLLQTRDGDGFVFRVDLRLRPACEATPIALPVDAAVAHYESSALAWERAAFIRARAAAGDVGLGQRFLDTIQPFVWRRSLDFGAIGDLRALTRSIRSHHKGQMFGPGYDLKRGRGGIREVEFYAQIHQLIHGGRDPALRDGATLPALSALAKAGWIGGDEAAMLGDAYRLYRTIEHRLQMIDDRQTHSLPVDQAALDDVARLHGLAAGDELLDLLRGPVAAVGEAYDALDGETEGRPTSDTTGGAELAGFADPEAAAARIERWRSGGVRAIRSPAAVSAFEELLPDILADLARAPDPDAALARLDIVLGRLSSGINLFRLLDAQPAVRALLVDILSHAPTLADALALQPALIDRLIDRTALGPVPGTTALAVEMASGRATDTETLLDRVRHIVGEYRFALGTQIVEGASDPIDVAAGYGRLAEAAIAVVADRIIADFEAAHGRVTGCEFVIFALGRMGGGLLTHASDLDLVYLFTGDFSGESDGARPLGATHYFNRLGQRLTAALSVPTAAGGLYEIDTRLRPSGTQGPLVTTVESLARYQRESAWTWEHMALARARPVYGSAAARAALADIVTATLRQPRDRAVLLADVVKMRGDIATHKPPAGPFDVKLGTGGLVDLEFAVHFAQLANGAGLSPDLRVAIDALAVTGLVEPALGEAHDLLTRLLVTLRLVAPDLGEPVPASRDLVARACGATEWPDLLARLDVARQCVSRHWNAVLTEAGDA